MNTFNGCAQAPGGRLGRLGDLEGHSERLFVRETLVFSICL